MTPEFSNLVDPVFQCVLDFVKRIRDGRGYDLQHEFRTIRDAIDAADHRARLPSSMISSNDWQTARKALVYWADEVLTVAAPDWQNILLEREYYETRSRASAFYVEGERNGLNGSPDVVETFYLAIVLGFVGDISDAFRNHLKRDLPGGTSDPNAAREAWARQLEQRIRQAETPEISGQSLEGHVAPLTGGSLKRVGMIVFGVVCVLCVVGWMVMLLNGETAA